MLNPLTRMRKERRWALIIFNLLLLAAAVLQLVSVRHHGDAADAHQEPFPGVAEYME